MLSSSMKEFDFWCRTVQNVHSSDKNMVRYLKTLKLDVNTGDAIAKEEKIKNHVLTLKKLYSMKTSDVTAFISEKMGSVSA